MKADQKETSDNLLSELFRDMHALIESRRPGMSAEDTDRALAFVASASSMCAAAALHCNQMSFADAQARQFMRSVLCEIVANSREAMQCAAPAEVVH